MRFGNAGSAGALCIALLCGADCSDASKTQGNDPSKTAGNDVGTGGAQSFGSGGRPGTGGSGPSAATGVAGTTPGTRAATGGAEAPTGDGGSAGPAAPQGAGGSAPAPDAGGAGGAAAPAAACDPANKTPDPMKGSFTSIPGYQNLTKEPTTGPLKPALESDPGLQDWTVYRPDDLGDGKHAVLAWANGGCLQNGTLYGQWLLELASYGFIVLADGQLLPADADPAAGGIRSGADGGPQLMALAWITSENDRPCSQYFHKIDVTKFAVAGQSCGGLMSLSAAGDKRIATAIIFNSGLFSPDQSIYSALHAPMAYFIGGMSDIAYSNAETDVANINNVPLFYGNLDVGHGATWMETNAGEFGRVGLGWLKWQLLGDDAAKKMFVGADCELCKPPSMWVVQKKMID
jgi:hypothetical protein